MPEYKAFFHFHHELRDFFTEPGTAISVQYGFDGKPSVKDAIEAIGIPHTEVDTIVVNGAPVGFGYHLADGDAVSVYPASFVPDLPSRVALRGEPRPAFVVDVNLGKLARLLRMLGFDAAYRNDFNDHEIAELAEGEGRTVLTRDRRLLRFKVIEHGYWLRSDDPRVQISEVIRRYGLSPLIKPFKRCLVCNGRIEPVEKEKVIERLEPRTKIYYEEFYICSGCSKIYWKGSHYDHMNETLGILWDSNR
jgi:uncharacterized protein with PIN domain